MDQPMNANQVLRLDNNSNNNNNSHINYNLSAERSFAQRPDEEDYERPIQGNASEAKEQDAIQSQQGLDTVALQVQPVQQESGQNRFTLGFKLLLLAFVGSFLMGYRLFGIPTASVPCIRDRAFNALAGVNQAINNDHQFGYALIISTSLCIDFFSLAMIGYWLLHGTSARLAAVILLFYMIRSLHLYMYTPRFPQGFFFEYPGFPSIMVPYGRQSDFFFSGHCGILTITTLEWHTLNKWKMFYPNLVALFYTAFCLMALRVHYFIDVSSGIVFAHWLHLLISKYQFALDSNLRKLQTCIGNRFQKCSICKPSEAPQEQHTDEAVLEKDRNSEHQYSA